MDNDDVELVFYTRLFLGVLGLRKEIIPHFKNGCSFEENIKSFDELYDNILQPLCSSRKSFYELKRLIHEYGEKLKNGSITRLENGILFVDETIDQSLQELATLFFVNSYIAFHEQQRVMDFFQIEIKPIYLEDREFERKIGILKMEDKYLAEYLVKARSEWSSQLVHIRNDIEHKSFRLPRIEFQRSSVANVVEAVYPNIEGKDILRCLKEILNGLINFIESLTIYGLQHAVEVPIVISEIPLHERNNIHPSRFELGIDGVDRWSNWVLEYNITDFLG